MDKPIRVLEVFHSVDCGGAESMIMNLYRKIDRDKVQFDFLIHTTEKCFFEEEIKSLGGNIYRVPYYNVVNQHDYVRALRNFFENHPEISVVHGHVGSCAHLYLKVAKEYGCFTIAHSHSTAPSKVTLRNIAYRVFTFKTRRIADYFIGCGEAAGEYRFGSRIVHDKNRYSVLKNAIDVRRYTFDAKNREAVREEFRIGDKLLFGHVARFYYEKNHSFLIDIFNEINQINPETKLLLIGDGELRSEIEKKVRILHLEDAVIFAGIRNDVARLLQGMDGFIFPSYYEGLPVTLIEAQAADLPCFISSTITDEVKVTEDLVHSLDLKLQPRKWAEYILSTCSHRARQDRSVDIGNAGYNIENTSQWLQQFYLDKSTVYKRHQPQK